MARILTFIAALFSLSLAAPAAAQSLSLVSMPVVFVKSAVVQQVHAGKRIGALAPQAAAPAWQPPRSTTAFVPRPRAVYAPAWRAPVLDRSARDYRRGIAQYGPFLVLDTRRVALVGETDERTPGAFRAMIRAYPGLAQLDMVECPGTRDDRANMAVGRMIRAARLITHVPASGSVRSGAVELFLAGVERDISDGAEFAVHSWMDDYGREAGDFAESAPENRQYVDYYREMGMSDAQARGFYAMTNSVPHHRARWLGAGEMRGWLGPSSQQARPQQARARPAARKPAAPRLKYASLSFS